ncbi:MAG: signal recognition particle-docking protein FtsY [Lachnospiraceae bacterium]|nr:signal recognition particle-docking protein FtsY [Lachnospiraceae bacterium]
MAEEKKSFFKRLSEGLTKTRNHIAAGFDEIFLGTSGIDDDFYDDIEELLITSDFGVQTTEKVIEELRQRVYDGHITKTGDCRQLLIRILKEQLTQEGDLYAFEQVPSVILLVGVNGAGKTTTAGKLAANYRNAGKRVLLAAADTYRAAATDQLKKWSERSEVPMITGAEGSDPASVVFDAAHAAKARKTDLLICDTAGRLHNKKNLMNELNKIFRVLEKEYPEAHLETLVVLDGTTGQNALVQAKEFGESTKLDGAIITKLDGTAKGGMAMAVQDELNIPVKFIGVGEHLEDLQKFDPEAFVDALFA